MSTEPSYLEGHFAIAVLSVSLKKKPSLIHYLAVRWPRPFVLYGRFVFGVVFYRLFLLLLLFLFTVFQFSFLFFFNFFIMLRFLLLSVFFLLYLLFFPSSPFSFLPCLFVSSFSPLSHFPTFPTPVPGGLYAKLLLFNSPAVTFFLLLAFRSLPESASCLQPHSVFIIFPKILQHSLNFSLPPTAGKTLHSLGRPAPPRLLGPGCYVCRSAASATERVR